MNINHLIGISMYVLAATSVAAPKSEKDFKELSPADMQRVLKRGAISTKAVPVNAKTPKPYSSKVLSLAKAIPPKASTATLAQHLNLVIEEIGSTNSRDLAMVYEALALLRKQENVINAMNHLYETTAADNYSRRSRILQIVGELQRPDALPFLEGIVFERLPTPIAVGPEDFSPREREEMIHAKAAEGIAYLKDANGIPLAASESSILKIIKVHESLHVRVAAMDAYMWNHRDSLKAKEALLKVVAPEDQKFIARPRFARGIEAEAFASKSKDWNEKWEKQ